MIVFLGFIGISMPYLIFPALFLNPTYSILPASWSESSRALFLGVTLAAYPLGQFLGSPILGSLSDDYGRKRLLAASLGLSAICNLLTGFAIDCHFLILLILSRFAAGLMEGNIAIARAMAAELTILSKHETFGKMNACTSIAFLIGPLLGGALTDQSLFAGLTASAPFYFICPLFFLLTGLSILILEETAALSSNKKMSFLQRINLFKRVSALFSNKRLEFLMLTSTCFTLAVDIFYEFGPVYLTVKWGLDPAQLIIYNGVLCLALAIGNGWLPPLVSSRFPSRSVVISCIGAFGLILIGVVLAPSPPLMITLFTLSGLVIGLAVTLLTVKISNSVPDAIQGEVLGVQISLRVLGDAVICLFGGALLLLSPKLILVVAVLLSLLAMTYYAFLRTSKISAAS